MYRAILAVVRSRNLIALAATSSGVTTTILPGGLTAHSRFKIPLQTEDNITCCISKQSGLAKLLKLVKIIIWDETPMMNKQVVESLDNIMQDINECDLPFGGKVIVFGGDFRQILPVIPRGNKEEIINASLVMSHLWPLFIKIKLTQNMRASNDPEFSKLLLCISDGKDKKNEDDNIQLPAHMIIPYQDNDISLQELVNVVFPNLNICSQNLNSFVNRAILIPKNNHVDEINNLLIEYFSGNSIKYYSFDETLDPTEHCFQEDFSNTLTPNGFPPHELILKPNCPIILLRNLNAYEGLCNGTRLFCRHFQPNIVANEYFYRESP